MSLSIDQRCINCDMCEPECPNQAIRLGNLIYEIDPELCTECVGHYQQPSCVEVCPIGCINIDINNIESRQQLEDKFANIISMTRV